VAFWFDTLAVFFHNTRDLLVMKSTGHWYTGL